MVRATVTMTVREGQQGAFEPAWRAVATEARRAPGHLRQALARDPDDPRVFVVTSDWETAEAFREFERSPQQDVLTAPLRELRESASMTVHELVAHLEGDAPCPHE
jgi:heme-degrading monooxygenase HmoA